MNFLYFSNNSKIIEILDPIKEIDTVFIDLEINGKRARQANTNSFISDHIINDISKVKKISFNTIVGARINPMSIHSKIEINDCINRGAEVIMLPMFKSTDEVFKCLDIINGRCKLDLLFETPESLLEIYKFPLNEIRFVHFGINDISLALKYKNMFECLVSGILEIPTKYLNSKEQIFGIGGVGVYNAKPISPKLIIEMHKYYSSSRVILSRNFLDNLDLNSTEESKISNESQIINLMDLISSIMDNKNVDFEKSKSILKKTLSNV